MTGVVRMTALSALPTLKSHMRISGPIPGVLYVILGAQAKRDPDSPDAGIRHRSPGFRGSFRPSRLQQLDRYPVGRTHERHMSIARRAIDGDTAIHQPLARLIDIVD